MDFMNSMREQIDWKTVSLDTMTPEPKVEKIQFTNSMLNATQKYIFGLNSNPAVRYYGTIQAINSRNDLDAPMLVCDVYMTGPFTTNPNILHKGALLRVGEQNDEFSIYKIREVQRRNTYMGSGDTRKNRRRRNKKTKKTMRTITKRNKKNHNNQNRI